MFIFFLEIQSFNKISFFSKYPPLQPKNIMPEQKENISTKVLSNDTAAVTKSPSPVPSTSSASRGRQTKMPTPQEMQELYDKITPLQKIVTLQHIYSLYMAAAQQTDKKEVSFNIIQLQRMINSNPLVNLDFDFLNISGYLNSLKDKSKEKAGGIVPGGGGSGGSGGNSSNKGPVSPVQLIQILTESLTLRDERGRNEQVIQQVPNTMLFKLSRFIDLNFVKDRLIKLLNAYKNTTLKKIEELEEKWKTKKREIQMIEEGKMDDSVLYEEFLKDLKRKRGPSKEKMLEKKKNIVASTSNSPESSNAGTPIPVNLEQKADDTRSGQSDNVGDKKRKEIDNKMEVKEETKVSEKQALKGDEKKSSHTSQEEVLEGKNTIETSESKKLEVKQDTVVNIEVKSQEPVIEKRRKKRNGDAVTEESKIGNEKEFQDQNGNETEQGEQGHNKNKSEEQGQNQNKNEKQSLNENENEKEGNSISVSVPHNHHGYTKDQTNDNEGKRKLDDGDVEEARDSKILKKPKTEETSIVEEDKPQIRLRTRSMVNNENTVKKFQQLSLPILTNISSHRIASMFLTPVNAMEEPDYFKVIKKPIDLKTIIKKVRNFSINTLEELEFEMQLMFTNAIMYNTSDKVEGISDMMKEWQDLVVILKENM